MVYGINDIIQASIGAFSSVFLFLLIRSGNPVNIEPKIGLMLGIVWLFILYNPFTKHAKEAPTHYFGNLIITMVVCWYLSLWFGLVDPSVLWTMNYFGTTAWLTVLLASPVANLFDKLNLTDVTSRYYARRK